MISLSASLFAGFLAQAAPLSAPTIIEPAFYFDRGATEHRPEDERNYRALLDLALRPSVTAIVVTAHTDTAGLAEDNMVLSESRGRNLAKRLIEDGVSRSLIRSRPMAKRASRGPPPTMSTKR